MKKDKRLKNLVILASGGGSTFAYLHDCLKDRQLPWRVAAVVTDNPTAGVLGLAKTRNVQTVIVEKDPAASLDQRLSDAIQGFSPDLVLLAGFLRKVGPRTVQKFSDRMINSHPSLLPKFGGRGMYGDRVHAAVLASSETETGVTIHYVNEQYDGGRILRQKRVEIPSGATAKDIEALVKDLEKRELFGLIEDWQTEKL
jgi:phosphoribosylglycinamide formyltransferase-1